MASCTPNARIVLSYENPNLILAESQSVTTDAMKTEGEQDLLMRFITQISNIPSPSSNLKYINQQNNVFEIKYGDGRYTIVSDDTAPLKFDCSDASSMKPAYDCHDRVILREVETNADLTIGDIVLYKNAQGQSIMHRLVEIKDGKYYMRKDNPNNMLNTLESNGVKTLHLNDAGVGFKDIKYKVVGIVYR